MDYTESVKQGGWYDELFYYLDIEDVERLVSAGVKRHAPLHMIFVLSRLSILMRKEMLPKLDSVPVSQQQGGGKNKKKKTRKKTTRKNDDNKEENKKNKKGNEETIKRFCSIISVPYGADKTPADSLRKVSTAYPWYEFCLYTFRNEPALRRLLLTTNRTASDDVKSEHVMHLADALTVAELARKNIMFLHQELTRLSSHNVETNAFNTFAFPGFFIDAKNPARLAPIEAIAENEKSIQSSLLNRTLEYVRGVRVDKFIISHNQSLRRVVGRFASLSDVEVSPSFSRLSYYGEQDKFSAYFGIENIIVSFRILRGSYPEPSVINTSFIDDSHSHMDEVTLIEGDPVEVHDVIMTWVEADANHLEFFPEE
jgi:hypothetical protein